MTAVAAEPRKEVLVVKAANLQVLEVMIKGTSPFMQHAFSQKARAKIEQTQRSGSAGRGKKVREARNFEEDAEAATHRSEEGWIGIPAASFRNAMISACRLVGFPMTRAKCSIFCIQDGRDAVDGQGLVKLIAADPETPIMAARNETGVIDLRCRPMWREWGARVRIRYDADQFTAEDVLNLLVRAGQQVGIGEGRPDSKKSNGMGYGLFDIEGPPNA